MKSFTDLEQSKVLADILPLKSADMHYVMVDTENEIYSAGLSNYIGILPSLPCWSLAALLKIIGHYTLQTVSKDKKVFIVSEENHPICSDDYSEPVDACVAMVEKLNELNLL